MTTSDRYFTGLRRRAADAVAGNALMLGAEPATASLEPGGRPLELALNTIEKGVVKAGMKATGADKGFDRTVSGLTGGAFSPGERAVLEDRALTAASLDDVGVLKGVSEGAPVILTPQQKVVVDRIVGGLGSDALGTRAREAYGKAVRGGQVRSR